jgi:hypothetical protein
VTVDGKSRTSEIWVSKTKHDCPTILVEFKTLVVVLFGDIKPIALAIDRQRKEVRVTLGDMRVVLRVELV